MVPFILHQTFGIFQIDINILLILYNPPPTPAGGLFISSTFEEGA